MSAGSCMNASLTLARLHAAMDLLPMYCRLGGDCDAVPGPLAVALEAALEAAPAAPAPAEALPLALPPLLPPALAALLTAPTSPSSSSPNSSPNCSRISSSLNPRARSSLALRFCLRSSRRRSASLSFSPRIAGLHALAVFFADAVEDDLHLVLGERRVAVTGIPVVHEG